MEAARWGSLYGFTCKGKRSYRFRFVFPCQRLRLQLSDKGLLAVAVTVNIIGIFQRKPAL